MSVKSYVFTFCVLGIFAGLSTANAQQYSLEYIGHFVKDSETITKATVSGYILGNVDSCPFLYNEKNKTTTKLCDRGLTEAFDVNENGIVVGSKQIDGKDYPVYWSKSTGVKRIPLFSDKTEGKAYGVNNKGEVVGYQVSRTIIDASDYYDANNNGVCDDLSNDDENDEGPCTTEIEVPKAFRYSKAKGLRTAFNVADSRMSIAVKINNKGNVAGYIGDGVMQEYLKFTVALQKTNAQSKFVGAPHLLKTRVWTDISAKTSYGGITFDIPSLNDKNVVLNGDQRIDFNAVRAAATTVAHRFMGGRSDFAYSGGISEQNTLLAYKNGYSVIQTPSREAVGLGCLVPANTAIGTTPFTMKDVSVTDKGIFQGENIIFPGDISGDNKNPVYFKLKKLSKDKFGLYYTFCPSIEMKISCQNPATGVWKTYLKQVLDKDTNTLRDLEKTRDYYSYSSGYDSDYLIYSSIPDGRNCAYSARTMAGVLPLYKADAATASQDIVGPHGEPCTTQDGPPLSADLLGNFTPLKFQVDSEFNHFVFITIHDSRFYGNEKPQSIKLELGDNSIASNPSCE